MRATECDRVADERVCNAAHTLHSTHVLWARSAIEDNPKWCYQCHCFARIVLKADAARIGAPDV